MQTRCLFGCSFSLVVVLAGAAQAQTEAKPAHGAAAMADQQRELDTFGLSADGAKIPATVDAQAFAFTVPKDNAPDAKRIALGRKLYFETALSARRHGRLRDLPRREPRLHRSAPGRRRASATSSAGATRRPR